jgi:hypothetical protein
MPRARGIGGFLNISTREREWEAVVAVAHRESDVWASVGIHPNEADAHADLGAAALLEATHDPRVIGIGETGLDYYYDHSDQQIQRDLFRMHIGVARETGLPLIIHTREAEADTLAILTEEMGKGLPGADPLLHRQCRFWPGGPRSGADDLDFRDRDLQERQGLAGLREDDPARPAARRDRRAVPRAGPPSRQAMRTGLRGRYGCLRGQFARGKP